MTVVLSQTAPWNPRLGNPYRTRWAQVGDRMFRVHSDSLDGMWEIEECTEDGKLLVKKRPDPRSPDWNNPEAYEFGYNDFAFRLSEVRAKIEAACA